MNKMLNNIKESKGFVSIEFILIAGSVIILAGLVLFLFNGKAEDVALGAVEQMETANIKMNGDDK